MAYPHCGVHIFLSHLYHLTLPALFRISVSIHGRVVDVDVDHRLETIMLAKKTNSELSPQGWSNVRDANLKPGAWILPPLIRILPVITYLCKILEPYHHLCLGEVNIVARNLTI